MSRRWLAYCCQFTFHSALFFAWIIPADCRVLHLDLSQIIWPTWQWSADTGSLKSHLCRLYCQSSCAPYTRGCLGGKSGINYARSKKRMHYWYAEENLLFSVDTSKRHCPTGCLRSELFAVLKLFSVVSHTSPFCHEGVDVHQRCQELERNLKSRLLPENRRWVTNEFENKCDFCSSSS